MIRTKNSKTLQTESRKRWKGRNCNSELALLLFPTLIMSSNGKSRVTQGCRQEGMMGGVISDNKEEQNIFNYNLIPRPMLGLTKFGAMLKFYCTWS